MYDFIQNASLKNTDFDHILSLINGMRESDILKYEGASELARFLNLQLDLEHYWGTGRPPQRLITEYDDLLKSYRKGYFSRISDLSLKGPWGRWGYLARHFTFEDFDVAMTNYSKKRVCIEGSWRRPEAPYVFFLTLTSNYAVKLADLVLENATSTFGRENCSFLFATTFGDLPNLRNVLDPFKSTYDIQVFGVQLPESALWHPESITAKMCLRYFLLREYAEMSINEKTSQICTVVDADVGFTSKDFPTSNFDLLPSGNPPTTRWVLPGNRIAGGFFRLKLNEGSLAYIRAHTACLQFAAHTYASRENQLFEFDQGAHEAVLRCSSDSWDLRYATYGDRTWKGFNGTLDQRRALFLQYLQKEPKQSETLQVSTGEHR